MKENSKQPLIEVLKNDREYLLLQAVISGLREGQYYDKADLANVLQKYNEWTFKLLKTTIDLATQTSVEAASYKLLYETLRLTKPLNK